MFFIKKVYQKDYLSCFELDSNTISLWSKDQWKSEFKKNGANVFAINLINKMIGICVCQVVVDEAQINYFSIDENYRREGHGSCLMSFVIKKCETLNVKKLSLEVSEKNISAIKFYDSFEFVSVGFRTNYYRDGCNAVLKEKILKKTNF